jgi:hypothetical protein
MEHDGRARGPDVVRDPFLEERADDHIRVGGGDGRPHGVLGVGRSVHDLVSICTQIRPHPLGEAVEGRAQQEDSHADLRGSDFRAQRYDGFAEQRKPCVMRS